MGDTLNEYPASPANSAEVPSANPPSVPEHQLIRLIGRGSSGQVWLARNALGTYRAVKIVQQPVPSGQRTGREFQGILCFEPVSRLHDGLVDVLQVGRGEEENSFYYVMELADDITSGQTIVPERYRPRTLAHDLSGHRRLPIGECIRLGAALASALGFLHRQGLVHRDIKPSNIIFVNGFPKLADIGLVTTRSEPRSQLGTDGFISPEGAGSPQADIYSLGKVLYEMITGKDRNAYPELPADLGNHLEDRDLVEFIKIVIKACRTRPVMRFRSADELMTALLSFQFETSRRHQAHSRKLWSKVIGLGGLLVGVGVVALLLYRLLFSLK
jgi:eukaryotic-like serine/threonine-protein kinase